MLRFQAGTSVLPRRESFWTVWGTRDHRDPGPTGRQRQRRICIIRHFDKTVTYAQFTLHSHEPVSLLGTDTAVSPAEYILKALPAACYIAALASLATGSAHSKRAHDPRHLGQPGPCHHPPLLTPDGHRQGKPWAGSCTQRGYPHRIALGHEASALRQFVGVGHNWACPQGDFFVSAIHNLPRLGVSKRRDVTRDGHRLPEIIRKAQSRWQGRVRRQAQNYRRRHLRFADGSRPGAKTSPSHAVPGAPGHEGVRSNTAVQATRRSCQTSRHQQEWAPAGAHKGDLYTHSSAQKPQYARSQGQSVDNVHTPNWPVHSIAAPLPNPVCGSSA